jgi:hypothetical protein
LELSSSVPLISSARKKKVVSGVDGLIVVLATLIVTGIVIVFPLEAVTEVDETVDPELLKVTDLVGPVPLAAPPQTGLPLGKLPSPAVEIARKATVESGHMGPIPSDGTSVHVLPT